MRKTGTGSVVGDDALPLRDRVLRRLRGSGAADEAAAIFASALPADGSGVLLDLSDGGLRPEHGASAAALVLHPLVAGRVSGVAAQLNKLGDRGVEALCAAACAEGLRLLSLRNNGTGPRSGPALARALEAARGLRVLDVSRCGLGAEGAAPLWRALAAHPTLETLAAAFNRLGPEGGRACAAALREGAPALRALDLEGNRVGSAAEEVVDAASGLDSLVLSANGVGDASVPAFVRTLKEGRGPRRHLYLASNRIDRSLARLAWCVDNGRLETLDLRYNGRGEAANRVLLQCAVMRYLPLDLAAIVADYVPERDLANLY